MTAEEPAPDPDFEALLQYVKDSRGFDFTGYKRSSLRRRVDRQMANVGVPSYEAYQDLLEVQPDEFTDLFNTVLINVTSFFRDADAWAHLRTEILPGLLERKKGEQIRVWSAGCATGQEAYTLALILADELGVEEFRRRVKIYATDVDEDALSEARQATFSERDLRNIPPPMVEKYFEPAGQRLTFLKELRRAVIFGRNDLVQDAPISHVDLLCCRNTLMYFNAETQANIVQRLHFALEEHGVLFLGKAEMLLRHTSLFLPADLKRRFFSKVEVTRTRERGLLVGSSVVKGTTGETDGLARLRQEAMNGSPVAQLVLDAEGRTVLSNQRADSLFGLTVRELGRPFQDLELSYRPVDLRTPVDEANAQRRPVWVRDVEWNRGGSTVYLDVQIVPLLDRDGRGLGTSLFFSDVSRYRQLQGELEYAHRQLETAYEELQSTNEELETTNEELQSTVEELETTNEELQSTNEELETMNEELQSTNDELQSINDQLRISSTQLDEANDFLETVLTSMEAGVAVVDPDLRIRMWNRRAEDLWGLRSSEVIGQHFLNLDIGLPIERLRPVLRAALGPDANGAELQVDAVNRRGRAISVRVACTPLRHREGGTQPEGAIIVMETGPVDQG